MRKGNGQAGFSILEALAAFAILAMFLTVLYETLNDNLRNSERAKYASQATMVASSQLDLIRARRIEPIWNERIAIPNTRFSMIAIPSETSPGTGVAARNKIVAFTLKILWEEAGVPHQIAVPASMVIVANA